LAVLVPDAAGAADAAPAPTVNINWGGYIKLDILGSRFSDGAVAQSTARDFYVPNGIPAAANSDDHTYLDFHAKETRLFVKADTALEGHKLGAYVEFDFISGVVSGSEAVTNAYNPALRRAYVTYDNWLVGQDWTTFAYLTSLPETLDFVAWPSDGTVFGRQAQVRYTVGGLSLALENPESTVAANNSATFANADDNVAPDLIARYIFKAGPGDISVAGLVRQIVDNGTVGGANDREVGVGASVAGKFKLGSADDIRFTVSGGKGIGRYLALNTVGDAVVDDSGELDAVTIINGFVAYHHDWSSRWRSNLVASAFSADTGDAPDSDLAAGATRRVTSASVNLLYSPVAKLTFGGELRHARRETVGDESGYLDRLQLSAKYAF
jgi:hypothetical protein